jgi:hypothetical protein
MKTRWTFVSAFLFGLSMGLAEANAVPGEVFGPDPFQIFFDEFGTGFYQVFNPTTGQYGPIVNDPGTVVRGFLRYRLPEAVGLGDVAITGPAESETCASAADCSDGLRFILEGGVYYMQYFSDLPFGETPTPLADTGFPADFDFLTSARAAETGTPDVFESFLYAAGPTPHTQANSNFYNGVSDGRLGVPEPASITLLGAALLGIGAALRWRA